MLLLGLLVGLSSVTPGDGAHLRLGLLAVVVVATIDGCLGDVRSPLPQYLQNFAPRGVWGAGALLIVTLAWLQYAAFGVGQPLESLQHVLDHALSLIGLTEGDRQALQEPIQRAVRADPGFGGALGGNESVGANGLLLLYAVVGWIGGEVLGTRLRLWKRARSGEYEPKDLNRAVGVAGRSESSALIQTSG